jgi:O-acetyl-ADP-ribose deacetylase (regulator of RNase III)
LRRLQHELEKERITSLALPRLATGVGKLEWEEVKPLIDKHLGHLPLPIFVYATYTPGVRAVEPGL